MQTMKLQLEHQLCRSKFTTNIGVFFVCTARRLAVTRRMISARVVSASLEVSSFLRLKSNNSYIVLVLMSTQVN